MAGLFLIGLPVQLRARLEAAAKAKGSRVTSILAGPGKEGAPRLLPHPTDAIYKLRQYLDEMPEKYDEAYVLVLPYAPLPTDVADELNALEQLGAEVVIADRDQGGWPAPGRGKIDTLFLNALHDRLMQEMFGDAQIEPADHFRSLAERSPQFLIVDGALDRCADVAPHRKGFLTKAAAAFAKFLEDNGNVGPLDAFFKAQGLDHAQSGGINTTLEVYRGGSCVHHRTANTHLKQGDNTTARAAARVYYQHFFVKEVCHVALIYVGPHPETDITCSHHQDSVGKQLTIATGRKPSEED